MRFQILKRQICSFHCMSRS